jgi:hypothetical protein
MRIVVDLTQPLGPAGGAHADAIPAEHLVEGSGAPARVFAQIS